MKMTFSEFAKLLYNHIGNRCGADVFTYDLLTNILDPASNTILEELQPDTLRKYYNGRRSIAPLAKRVLPFIEPTCFSVYLERKCSDATAANIAADLEEYGVSAGRMNCLTTWQICSIKFYGVVRTEIRTMRS